MAEDTTGDRKAYARGWLASQRYGQSTTYQAETPLERADMRGEVNDWYRGYEDYAAGRDKWANLGGALDQAAHAEEVAAEAVAAAARPAVSSLSGMVSTLTERPAQPGQAGEGEWLVRRYPDGGVTVSWPVVDPDGTGDDRHAAILDRDGSMARVVVNLLRDVEGGAR